jgi:hypothetical protein
MHRIFILVTLLVSAPLYADTETEIRAALDYFSQVWNEDDLEAMQGYYHADFVQVSDEGRIEREQNLENIRTLIDDGGDRGDLVHSAVVIESLGDTHAVANGQMALKFDDGSSLETWFVTVYVKTPFGWKAVLTRN